MSAALDLRARLERALLRGLAATRAPGADDSRAPRPRRREPGCGATALLGRFAGSATAGSDLARHGDPPAGDLARLPAGLWREPRRGHARLERPVRSVAGRGLG